MKQLLSPLICVSLYYVMGVGAMAQLFRRPLVEQTCPLIATKANFDLNKFMGNWYVQEYVYNKQMPMKDLSCVGFHFSKGGFGELQSNFTFRFPSKIGHFYHVPTFSLVDSANSAVWETQFGRKHLVTLILETDYDNWALLVQCKRQKDGTTSFLSTRILSRKRNVDPKEVELIDQVISSNDPSGGAGQYRYPVEQGECSELD